MFDIDGVLADWMVAFTRLGHERYGTPIASHHDSTSWDDMHGLTKQQVTSLWDHIKQTPEFWGGVPPMLGAGTFTRIRHLAASKGHDVYFVTARPGYGAKAATEEWLRRYCLSHPTVVMSRWKGEAAKAIEADFSIEDKAGNAVYVAYQSPATKSYLIDRPYNQFPPDVLGRRVIRVQTVDEYLDAIQPSPEAPLLAA